MSSQIELVIYFFFLSLFFSRASCSKLLYVNEYLLYTIQGLYRRILVFILFLIKEYGRYKCQNIMRVKDTGLKMMVHFFLLD